MPLTIDLDDPELEKASQLDSNAKWTNWTEQQGWAKNYPELESWDNAQTTFDKIVEHLRKQKTKAISATAGCCYRSGHQPDGVMRCAAGCLIPDEIYRPFMEGRSLNVYRMTDPAIPEGTPPGPRLSAAMAYKIEETDADLLTRFNAFRDYVRQYLYNPSTPHVVGKVLTDLGYNMTVAGIMQHVHDQHSPQYWESLFRWAAGMLGLTYTPGPDK